MVNRQKQAVPYGQKFSGLKKKTESHKRIPQMGNYMGANTLNANTGNFVFQKKTSGRDWYYDDWAVC